MKFKVGDEVIVVADALNECMYQSGKITKITKQFNGYPYYIKFDDQKYNSNPWRETELELKEIWDSPLAKALREEN